MPGKTLAAIVGFQHRSKALGYDVEAFVRKQPDGRPLTLVREPDNPHDRNAVKVYVDDVHVGYIKGTQVRPVAMAMDAHDPAVADGATGIAAKLSTRNGERYPFVEIDL